MLTDPNEKSIKDQKRMSRRQFRKERKLATRKAFRQYYAQKRDQKKEQSVEEEQEVLKQHSEYLQQKKLWEEREERYELINSVRRKAEEAERQARETARQKWRDALLRMPILPSTMISSSSDDDINKNNSNMGSNNKIQPKIRNMPTFVTTEDREQETSLPTRWPKDIDGDTMNWP
ncbi:hypothetical protein BDC45DRAFT_540776 [Circinella umbellata]|nr:hypothetical protein BDC45DRAFT_540776 [Circinella umbellata]